MKIYTVTTSRLSEDTLLGSDVKVFTSKEEARNEFKNQIKSETDFAHNQEEEYEIDFYSEDEEADTCNSWECVSCESSLDYDTIIEIKEHII